MCTFSLITIIVSFKNRIYTWLIRFFQTGFIEMAHIGVGKLYEAFKNWGTDITEEFKIGKAEQMFAQEKAVEVIFEINFYLI